ncbi:hypothetical protein [Runella aurantiaca]|uniref:Uncharacterized protein n=1 Tax=Runella aurantiaca TaxID=2282308 RepID=A0A369I9H8_9BACT|nr:hypothetical protein [Runella aurantiaca]RDB05722.1 hypothetical protein DVG78_12060 [Runella aurantiaca]
MKKLTAIGLLLLLLYNMFGLTVAVLVFEDDYQTASPVMKNDQWQTVKMHLPTLPYNNSWENSEGQEGLIRKGDDFYNVTHQRHENDTLYVTLKSNQHARDRFFELAEMIQEITDQTADSPESPLSKAVKLLSDLVKVYLPNTSTEWPDALMANLLPRSLYATPNQALLQSVQLLHSPPPERG